MSPLIPGRIAPENLTKPRREDHPGRKVNATREKPNYTSMITDDGQGVDSSDFNVSSKNAAFAGYGGSAGTHDLGYNSVNGVAQIDTSIHDLDRLHKQGLGPFPVSGSTIGKLGNKRIADLEDTSTYGGDLVDKDKHYNSNKSLNSPTKRKAATGVAVERQKSFNKEYGIPPEPK